MDRLSNSYRDGDELIEEWRLIADTHLYEVDVDVQDSNNGFRQQANNKASSRTA